MILIRRLSIPSIPEALPDGRCYHRDFLGENGGSGAALRWLYCNLLEWQGKGKSGPGCFVLPLADFPLGLRLSSTGFVKGKVIFETLSIIQMRFE
ncbi:hypothetical protein AVEN_65164-1 [Araneus ventricosus]|uniref:Uncharacterized protein n=1 Tax=Araneus ventricosus TaxID=182803 RepID=A0A4Y2AFI6_ARAVE|nr:hypothetical protein AVEN_65164-1 [Araneus ventricosus]